MKYELLAFLPIIVAHYVGDFALQTRNMAHNKSRSWTVLVAHVLTYTFVLWAAAIVVLYPKYASNVETWLNAAGVFVFVNAVGHFVTDAVTSRLSSRHYKSAWSGDPKAEKRFWNVVGADQAIHIGTLFVTFAWVLG